MMWGMLWIFGIYGAAVAILHMMYAIHRNRNLKQKTTYFALVTHNHEAQIEWYLRSLIFFSWLRGRPVSITVFDEESTDGTVDIVERFAEGREHVEIRIAEGSLETYLEGHQGDDVVLHRLNRLGKGEGLPVLQW
jgi:hypothetical protein